MPFHCPECMNQKQIPRFVSMGAKRAQKAAESAAMDSARNKQFFKSIIDAMPNMIGYRDWNLRFRFANKTYQAWFGKLPEAIIASHIRDVIQARQTLQITAESRARTARPLSLFSIRREL